jgi:hypothetical protein
MRLVTCSCGVAKDALFVLLTKVSTNRPVIIQRFISLNRYFNCGGNSHLVRTNINLRVLLR